MCFIAYLIVYILSSVLEKIPEDKKYVILIWYFYSAQHTLLKVKNCWRVK